MKRLGFIILMVVVSTAMVSCGSSERVQKVMGNETVTVTMKQDVNESRVLKSLDYDLDSDGQTEKIEVSEVTVQNDDGAKELMGILKISGKGGNKEVVYRESGNTLTGVFRDMKVKDVDGDSYPEVFISIPDVGGGGYGLNYFFLYSYKTGRELSFNQDFAMNFFDHFIKSFSFAYKSGGKLEMSSRDLGADFALKVPDENNGDIYNNSWIDPSPVVITGSGNNAITNIDICEDKDGKPGIRVPLLIFGGSTSNVVGEMDTYIGINSEFKPSITRFEVFSLLGDDNRQKVGEKEL